MTVITNCPGTLAPDHSTYCPLCLRQMFDGRKTSRLLPYQNHLPTDEKEMAELMDNRKRIAISEVQEKLSAIVENGKIRLTKEGEQGTYILKLIPRYLERVNQFPAN